MAPETISKVRPAFERFQDIVSTNIPKEVGTLHLELTLNDKEYFSIYLHHDSGPSDKWISCSLYQDHKATFAFRIIEGGLQGGLSLIEDHSYEVSFGGSPKIKVQGIVAIGNRGDHRAHLIGDAFDQKGFQALADPVVDWLERAVREGKVGEIPFSLSHSGQ